jgi:tetraacyldisaccharide 4'-kinase
LLLDDGFSHLRLARDVDLVLLPAGDPFGGGLLPPGGRLREPLAALGRADAVALVGATEMPADVAGELDRLGFGGRREVIAFETGPATLLDGGGPPPAPVLLVAGIARPERFFEAARRAVGDVVGELHFPDHHAYPPASLARIQKRAAELGAAAVLTTAKDRVKLERRLAMPLAELPLEARPSADLLTWIDRRCREVRRKDEP